MKPPLSTAFHLFHKANSVDACAVTHLLAATPAYRAALTAGCSFALTRYVVYECLNKKRAVERESDRVLKERLQRAMVAGEFVTHSLELEDLADLAALEARKRVDTGELASIALARKFRLCFLTDDRGAFLLAQQVLHPPCTAQSVPQLLGWLVIERHITDGEVQTAIEEHAGLGQSHAPQLEQAYHMTLGLLLVKPPLESKS